MPSYMTIAQFKNIVGNIPAAADTMHIEIPDTMFLPVLIDRVVQPDGTFYTVKGYMDFPNGQWVPVP